MLVFPLFLHIDVFIIDSVYELIFCWNSRFIYTGTVDVDLDVAPDLLKAADQYLLDGLKRICESVISEVGQELSFTVAFISFIFVEFLMVYFNIVKFFLQDISVENVSLMYMMSDTYNATSLKYSCILFILEQFDKLSSKPWYVYILYSLKCSFL